MINNPSPKRNVYLKGKKRPRARYLILIVIGLTVLCVSRPNYPPKVQVEASIEPEIQTEQATLDQHAGLDEPPVTVEEKQVRSGDTLYDILKAGGLPDKTILELSQRKIEGISPSRLVTGKSYRLYKKEDKIVEYQYEPDEEKILKVLFKGEAPSLSIEPIPYEVFRVPVSGVIKDSLFAAVEAIDEKPALAMDLADLFAWQVDFFRDLREGDTFTVLVDKYYREGDFIRYGKILAARFINNGNTSMGFLFKGADGREGYFDETGGSLRKQFLKAPLRFRRISSGFSRRRLHPVTGRVAAHLGIDYAARTGTPVMSIGDGKVLFKKRDSINGRIVKIRHNGTYSTAYAHLSGFAKGIAPGTRVNQGQIIGYVGQSGRATGPHLHFAMYRNGKYVDPRRIQVPRATSVPTAERSVFLNNVKKLSHQLDGGPREELAGGRL